MQSALPGLILAGLVVTVYSPAVSAGFIWDDQAVTNTQLFRGPQGLWRIWTEPGAEPENEVHYWPLVYTTFWIENALWGIRPVACHSINLLLHALNSVLLWLLLRRLELRGAWLAASLFALHPLQAESVAWVIERKDLLCALFYLLAFHAYARFEATGRRGAYGWAIALYGCAMLSKSVAVSLPVALGLWLWWKRGRLTVRDARFLAPLFALGALMAGLDSWFAVQRTAYASGLSWVDRGLLAGRELWFYAGKLAWPANLMTIYPRWEIDARSPWAWAPLGAAAGVLAGLWMKRRAWGRGPLAAVLFFASALGPTLGLIDFGYMAHSFVADRFQYLAGIGLIVLFSGVTAGASRNLAGRRRWLPRGGAAVLLAGLGVLTWRQARLYHDDETLFRDNLKKNPAAWAAHNNLGTALYRQGRYEEAYVQYSEALRIAPLYKDSNNNLGAVLLATGRIDEAAAHYRGVLQGSPLDASAHNNLGVALDNQGKPDEAIAHYREALRIRPDYADAHVNLGEALSRKGDLDGAVRHCAEGVRLNPDSVEGRYNLGFALEKMGKTREAVEQYREALSRAVAAGNARLTARIKERLAGGALANGRAENR